MENDGSSVTLIFYRISQKWWREPWLNIVAAAAQFSSLTHVEIAIGEESGRNGVMSNVCRVFNDDIGVELVERTGRNPQYTYLQLGCSKNATSRMLAFAKTRCVGRPFSNAGMVRSLLWPRSTDEKSFFCAELVAAILKAGGLMDRNSNPGSATPELLHRLYKDRSAATANPCLLRDLQSTSFASGPEQLKRLGWTACSANSLGTSTEPPEERRRQGHFRCVSQNNAHFQEARSRTGLVLTLNSLNMRTN